MADIVNLRRARKARARLVETDAAAAARARHGRTRAERHATEAAKERAARALDQAKRELPDGEPHA